MPNTPTLGPTDDDAHRQAYDHGYSAMDRVDPDHLLPDDVDAVEIIEDDDRHLSEFESVRIAVTESQAMKSLWWALSDYYAEHKTEEEAQRFEREAAVAEDFDTSFRAGAYAALRGGGPDPEGDLPFLDGDD